MRARVIEDGDGNTATLFFPRTETEYLQANAMCLKERSRTAAGRAAIVTTEEQRDEWNIPEPTGSGTETTAQAAVQELTNARKPEKVVLTEALPEPPTAASPLPVAVGPPLESAAPATTPDVESVMVLERSVGAPVQEAETADLDSKVAESLEVLRKLSTGSGELTRLGSGSPRTPVREEAREIAETFSENAHRAVRWWRTVTAMPVDERAPERFSRRALDEEIDARIWIPRQIREHLADALTACMRHRGKLYVEEPGDKATTVRRERPANAPSGILIAGPAGTAKSELARAAAGSLGRPWVENTTTEWGTANRWKGAEDEIGHIAGALLRTGVVNPVHIVHKADEATDEVRDVLSAAVRPIPAHSFTDNSMNVSWDISEIVWIFTAVDDAKLPENLCKHLLTVRTRGYTESEKVAIARRYARRPRGRKTITDTSELLEPDAGRGHDRGLDSDAELSIRWEGNVGADFDGETVRRAGEPIQHPACELSTEAALEIIRSHTDEQGTTVLCRKVNEVCARCAAELPVPDCGRPQPALAITREGVLRHLGRGAAAKLPDAVVEAIATEKARAGTGDQKEESRVDRNWIDWLENVPWKSPLPPPVPAETLLERLHRSHTGMAEAKRRIAEHLAAERNGNNNSVLCLAGPPGVGKTSLAQAVAAAAERPLVRLACGGWRDETDLRGHNRTWRDAQPGGIIRELRRARCGWPIFVLDEVDKIGPNPAAVLLEILDPGQRHQFRDAFLELPFDLSEVVFITTANETGLIQPALRDRLDIVPVRGYTDDEKIQIGMHHILPQAAAEAGLPASLPVINEAACLQVIRGYTREQGVRQLGRRLRTLCQRWANETTTRLPVDTGEVARWLGPPPDTDEDTSATLAKAVVDAALPPAAARAARRALRVIESDYAAESERNRARTYVETLTRMAWPPAGGAPALTGEEVRSKLRKKFVGQAGGISRIAAWAVTYGGDARQHPALCVIGLAGTGKTAMATEAAAALGLETAVVDCRTIQSGADVEGRENTTPGRIVRALTDAPGRTAALLLEHVDEIGSREGTAALAAVLAARGSTAFTDRYLQVEIDLGRYPILATAHDADNVPSAIQKTLDPVELVGYTNDEKLRIGCEYADAHSAAGDYRPSPAALTATVRDDREHAGVTAWIKSVETLMRRGGQPRAQDRIRPETPEETERRRGRAIGLALDRRGGRPLIIDAAASSGKGRLTMTGSLDRELRECVRTARQWLIDRSREFGLEPGWELETDLHVHMGTLTRQTGGSSAGIAIAAALASATTGRLLREGVCLTGEIGLGDHVREIGGVVEKVITAGRFGMSEMHVPEANRWEVLAETAARDQEIGPVKVLYARSACATVQQVLEEAGRDTDGAAADEGIEKPELTEGQKV